MLDVSLTALTMLVQIVTGLVVVNPWHTTDPVDIHEELYCLAINSYHEARGETFDDKLATAQVVMNRAESPKFPNDVWYCDGRSDAIHNLDGWEDSVIAAFLVYTGFGEDIVDGATHYYAHDKVSPSWARRMEVTVRLKGHTYLKER